MKSMKKQFLVLSLTYGSLLFNACGGGGMSAGNNGGGGSGSVSFATHFSVTGVAAATAGTAFNVVVTALDAANNTATTYSGTVHFTSTDAKALLPKDSSLANGTGTLQVTFQTAGNQTITASDSTKASITGTSGSISVSGTASPAIVLSVGVPSTATTGTTFNFNITALDPSNAIVVTSYSGPVHFTSSDARAVLPRDSSLTNGIGTFSATLNTVGSQSITATDTTSPAITGMTGPIAVFGPATHFSITAPSATYAGTAFDFTVTALDSSNNLAATYPGTAHFSSSDSHADLPSDSAITNGIATFPSGLKTSGSQTITVTDAVKSSITGTSGSINVGAAATANPVPMLDQPLIPSAVGGGSAGFMLTVKGTGFVPGCVVYWNGTPLVTTFLNTSKLTAAVPAANVASFNTALVTVVNPAPGGGTSNVAFFETTLPTSSIAFAATSQLGTGSAPVQILTSDFNGDGKLDLVTVNNASSNVTVLLGNGDGTFQEAAQFVTNSFPVSIASGDFNGDGKLDLAVATACSNSCGISIFLGNGDGTFQAARSFNTATGLSSIAVGDFNGDGKLDLVTVDPDRNGVMVFLGNGDGSFLSALYFSTAALPVFVAVGDFNGDGKLDLSVVNEDSSNVSVLLGNGDGTFQRGQEFPTVVTTSCTALPIFVTSADLNGDGKLDLVVGNLGCESISVLLGNGDGTFQAGVEYASGLKPTSVLVADFNGDGKPDLLLGRGGSNSVSLLLGNGDGTFQSALSFDDGSTGFSASNVAAGDFNDDGRLDIAVANSTGSTISLLLQPGLTSAPKAVLSSTSLTFVNQAAETTSNPQTAILTNYGLTSLSISSIATSNNFGQTDDCGSSLAPGASCTVSVTFSPTSQGNVTGTLSLTDDAPGSPQTVSLNSANTTVQLTPNSMTFLCDFHVSWGCQPQNETRTATLTNTGTGSLVISSITIAFVNYGFSETNNCPTNLSPGQSCTIAVAYHQGAPGSTGHLLVNDNASASPQTISLSGQTY